MKNIDFRDVKYLKYGRTALKLLTKEVDTVPKEGELGDILEFLFSAPRKLMTFIEYENATKKEINGKSYEHRSHEEYHYDLLEASGLLQTVNLRMKYSKSFKYEDFDLIDFEHLGGRRECRDHGQGCHFLKDLQQNKRNLQGLRITHQVHN